MAVKVYLHLLILCAIFSQAIFGTFVENSIGESSDVLIREKRVISRIPGEGEPSSGRIFFYVVKIKKKGRLHCVGTILSHQIVITAARCIVLAPVDYQVFSGSTRSFVGVEHNVTHKEMRGHSPSRSSTLLTGIALITVTPSFPSFYQIDLHAEPVLDGVSGTVSGWGGFVYGGPREMNCPRQLHAITVPIMNHRECRNIYRGYFPISDEEFCSYHPQRLCAYTDTGAPFVIGNKLVGVHLGRIETAGVELPIKPDVFVLLQHFEYSDWIRRNIGA